jgi:hypothetical protein
MIFQNACDCLCMLDTLFGDDSEIADGDSIIGNKIVQRILVVINNFIRWETGRHGGQVSLRKKPESSSSENRTRGLGPARSRIGTKDLGV